MSAEKLRQARELILQQRFEEAETEASLDDLFSLEGARLLWDLGHAGRAAQVLAALEPTEEVRINLAQALTRSGKAREALGVLEGMEGGYASLRRANAMWHLGDFERAGAQVEKALRAGRQDGDPSLTLAAVWQNGELALERDDGKAAVLLLAEGLKISEQVGQSADPYLLAVLAEAQMTWGHRDKARQTAQKALERSRPRHLSQVRAHLALQAVDVAHDLSPILELTRKLGWPFWEISTLIRMGRSDPACALEGLEKIRKLGLLGLLERAQRMATWSLDRSSELGE